MRTEYRFFDGGVIRFTVAEGEPPPAPPAAFPACFREIVRRPSGFANIRPPFRELGHLVKQLDAVLTGYWFSKRKGALPDGGALYFRLLWQYY